MRLRTSLLTALLLVFALAPNAEASLLTYRFTVTKALQHGAESIGGAASPVVFEFLVDPNGVNLAGASTTQLSLPIGDHGSMGYGAVSVGGVASYLQGGSFNIADGGSQDTVVGAVNGPDDGTRINGRSLFVSTVAFWDFTGAMIESLAAPTTNDFAAHISGGHVTLTFRPAAGDPEFLSHEYVGFSTFLSPSDVTVQVATVSEPGAVYLLMLAGSAAVVGGMFGRKATYDSLRSISCEAGHYAKPVCSSAAYA